MDKNILFFFFMLQQQKKILKVLYSIQILKEYKIIFKAGHI